MLTDPILVGEAAREFRLFVSKFGTEARRLIRNFAYELTDSGLVLGHRFLLTGYYSTSIDEGPWTVQGPNLVPMETKNFLLELLDKEGTTALNPVYFVLGSNVSYVPTDAITMATFNANATEVTAYSESTRQKLVAGTAASKTISNTGNEAKITSSSPNVVITIIGLSTSNVKGGTAGKLTSIKKLSASETLNNTGSELKIKFERTVDDV